MRETPRQLVSPDLGSPKKVWKLLCDKDDSLQRSVDMMARHPHLTDKMRSVLLEWIMDVCHDQRLHRETFHLCVDYIDRFLLRTEETFKPYQLQLVGATALVIAMKMEVGKHLLLLSGAPNGNNEYEIYPPKVYTIADLTDGSCTESQILDMEVCMLLCLDWNCTPVTAVHWLSLFLQLMNNSEASHNAPIDMQNVLKKRSPQRFPNFTPSSGSNDRSSSGSSSRGSQLDQKSIGRRSLGDENLEDEDDEENKENIDHSYICGDCTDMDAERENTMNSTVMLEMSYLGHSNYNISDCHFYPDKRCTVSKLMRDEFVRLASVLDLIILDPGSLRYKYSELAAAVVWHNYEPEEMVLEITGFRREELEEVLDWTRPFVAHYEKLEPTGVEIPSYSDISSDDAHNIQSYIPDVMKQLEIVNEEIKKSRSTQRARKRKLQAINSSLNSN